MALRLRRGTDAERLLITPADGEMIWTTDTQELYVGNGSTVGGIRITGALNDSPEALTRNLDLATNTIFGSGDINIAGQITTSGSITATGTVTAGSLVGDGSQIYNLSAANLDVSDLVVEGGTYYLNVVGPDSSIVLDASTGDLDVNDVNTATLVVSQDASIGGSVTANQYFGDLIGEVHAEDSTIVINRFGEIFSDLLTSTVSLEIANATGGSVLQQPTEDTEAQHNFVRRHSDTLTAGDNAGRLRFRTLDTNDDTITDHCDIVGGVYGVAIRTDLVNGGGINKSAYFHDGKLGLGTAPQTDYRFTSNGNINVLEGKLTLGSVETSEVGTPVNGDVVYAPGAGRVFFRENGAWVFPLTASESAVYLENTLPIQQANYSTTQIGLGLSGAQETGVLLFNTTEKQLQVYNDGWKNVASDGGVFKGDVNGSVGLDDSTTIIDGTDGKITAPNTVTFGSFSTAERDAIVGPQGGMVIFNNVTAKLQVYNGSTWLDLH